MDIEALQHRVFTDTALPYISNTSPIDETNSYIDGSNVMTSIKGFLERRPGFPTYTSDNFGANNTITRYTWWQTWVGVYYIFVNVVDSAANTSKVYKQKIGTDTTFQLIFTSTSNTNPFYFVVAHNFVFFGNGTDMKKYDGTTVYNWGTTTPASAPTLVNSGAGNVPGVIGHYYVFAFGNSTSGYISDISPVSLATAAASRTWTIAGVKSTDTTNIDQVHIYRTEDGGSVFREVSNSPITNGGGGSFSFADNDADTSLKATQAPLAGVNAPPTASNFCKLFANRIFTAVNDTLYWSALEEATNNTMSEEGFPTNNKRRFGKQITGLELAGNYLLIFTDDSIQKLAGYSLSTFAWATLSKQHGLHNAAALASDGDNAVWLDVTNTIAVSNGDTISYPDVSLPIRPDIASIVHASASLCINSHGKRNWVVLADGAAGQLRFFDLVKRQWMPPWAIANSAVGLIQTAAGTWAMVIGSSALPLKMAEDGTTYQDNGVSFTAYVVVGLLKIVPDLNPASTGILKYIGTERNAVALSNVRYLLDEDTAGATFTSVVAATIPTNPSTPMNRSFKTNLVEEWWHTNLQTAARRVALRLDWAAASANFKLYSFDLAYTDYFGGS